MPTSIAFPIRLDNRRGSLMLSRGNTRTQEQILEIIVTRFLERVMRPEFGNENYIFTSVSDPSAVASKVKFSLDTYLSSNISTSVSSKMFNDGRIELTINWFDADTNQQGVLTREFTI